MSDEASVVSTTTNDEQAEGVGVDGVGTPAAHRILSLVDGILVSQDDDRGVDDSETDEETSAGSVSSVLEKLATSSAIDDLEGEKVDLWSCPGESSDGKTCSAPGCDPRCSHSSYGTTNQSLNDLERAIGPDVDGGLVFTVMVLPNGYNKNGEKKLLFLKEKDYNVKAAIPKARRKMPFPITSNDFYESLHRIGEPIIVNVREDYDEMEMWDRDSRIGRAYDEKDIIGASPPRWLFSGVINGWPGIPMPLELLKIEGREPSFLGRRKGWSTLWDSEKHGQIKDPSECQEASEKRGLQVKAILRAPQWSAHGWSRNSPGFLFWVEGQKVGSKRNAPLSMTYGTNLTSHFKRPEEEDPLCTLVHMISHRYATGGRAETQKEKFTYHSLVLLEWDHKEYCSVVEIGYLNGLGGYRCKSNWYVDKEEPEPSLYIAFPPEMVVPWKETMSEIRVHDVPYPDLNAFLGFMKEYDGHNSRFVDTSVNFSHVVRLTYRSRRNVATYLLNYIRRDRTYNEMKRNCQTFAADLVGFLAGKKDVQPFHPVNQIQYTCQKHKFLYESSEYQL